VENWAEMEASWIDGLEELGREMATMVIVLPMSMVLFESCSEHEGQEKTDYRILADIV